MMVMGSICIAMSLSKGVPFFLKPASFCFILSGEIQLPCVVWKLQLGFPKWNWEHKHLNNSPICVNHIKTLQNAKIVAFKMWWLKWYNDFWRWKFLFISSWNVNYSRFIALFILCRFSGSPVGVGFPSVCAGFAVQRPLRTSSPWVVLVCGVCRLSWSHPHFRRCPFLNPCSSF